MNEYLVTITFFMPFEGKTESDAIAKAHKWFKKIDKDYGTGEPEITIEVQNG